jgi:hypothetical protein
LSMLLLVLLAVGLRVLFAAIKQEGGRTSSRGAAVATGVGSSKKSSLATNRRAELLQQRDEAEIEADDQVVRHNPTPAPDALSGDVAGEQPTSELRVDRKDGAQKVIATPRPVLLAGATADGADRKGRAHEKSGSEDSNGLLSALQGASEVNQPERDDMVGVRSSTAPAAAGGGGALAPELAAPTPTPEPQLAWVDGQARGYAMLYAMQPEARAVVEGNVRALLRSRVRQPFIAMLIDGTFGQDSEYAKELCRRLSSDGRRLTLALYLSNGPTMRVSKKTPIRALFSQIEPLKFRDRIQREVGLREQYQRVVASARELFDYNAALSADNSNVAVVMLEDNLDSAAYLSMRDLVRQGLTSDTTIVRNPCLGCHSGNDGASYGDPIEDHGVQGFYRLAAGDGFSLDGSGFDYPWDSASDDISASDLLRLMREGKSRGLRYMALWQHGWQGVVKNVTNVHPKLRQYYSSTVQEQLFEVDVLREGLFEEVAD